MITNHKRHNTEDEETFATPVSGLRLVVSALFRMLLVLSEDHKEHLAFLPTVDAGGECLTGVRETQS